MTRRTGYYKCRRCSERKSGSEFDTTASGRRSTVCAACAAESESAGIYAAFPTDWIIEPRELTPEEEIAREEGGFSICWKCMQEPVCRKRIRNLLSVVCEDYMGTQRETEGINEKI